MALQALRSKVEQAAWKHPAAGSGKRKKRKALQTTRDLMAGSGNALQQA